MDRVAYADAQRGLGHVRRAISGFRSALTVRDWQVWQLSPPLRVLVLAVICAYVAWVAVAANGFTVRAHDLVLVAALLGCGAATVELTRRASEPSGIVKDVYAVWELPVVILLPVPYALVVPAIRLALTQWRVRQAPPHRRAFTAAAIGLAYGCASLVFHAIIPVGVDARDYLWGHAALWLLAAGCCALTQWAVNQVLVLPAVKASAPATKVRDALLGRESLHNDATELCAAILVALSVQVSLLTLIVAFPLGTLLQRSYRHAQLLYDARADAKTGLLNAAAWEAEATAEVARAVRTATPLAVALLDLDRFKLINDTHGHLVGDQVLKRIAATMSEILRDYDLAGRFGGEEFVMLLPQTRAVDALRIAERVRAHIAQLPIYVNGTAGAERVTVTVSIGVAALDAGSRRELTELLAAADAALYRAKASGRDQVQMISTSRGLSAAGTPDAAASPAGRRGAGASVMADDEQRPGSLFLPRRAQRLAAAQSPDDDDEAGRSSTATTSALAV
ncbi:MAG TPA: GGDEF domain-containing protein [Trebonia sp.]|jgi:diguanylate cyclase (GGDEF)-like protein|nr:GGDEF domain-containing protein [Trebonia sp.]